MTPTADELRASLTDEHRLVLEAIVAAPLAWTEVSRLADRFAEATIAELEDLDLVTRWPLPTETCITLTSWGKFCLRVEIDERFQTLLGCTVEVPFWVMAGKGSEAVVLPRYPKEVRMPFPERVPAPEPEPEPEPEVPPADTIVGKTVLGVEVRPDRRPRAIDKPPAPQPPAPSSRTETAAALDRYLYRPPPTRTRVPVQ